MVADGSTDLTLDQVDYDLPEARIAQHPLRQRDASKLLHLPPGGGFEDRAFRELPELLRPGDLLVGNDTRVRRARLRGRRSNGGQAELLVLAAASRTEFACLVRPARRLPEGATVSFGDDLQARIGAAAAGHPGARLVEFEATGDVEECIERHGEAPLPPYIHQRLEDASRYQTTYATGVPESAAAPTAGLHFTDSVHRRLLERGIGWTTLRLEVGLGTFSPIRVQQVRQHTMHEERYQLPETTADEIARTRQSGGRVIAVGTTTVRVLESCVSEDGSIAAASGRTRLFVTPGYRFSAIDGMLTNFHQPRSSLIVMVAALIGLERWRAAYEHALAADYRFLSFGDCMLCWL